MPTKKRTLTLISSALLVAVSGAALLWLVGFRDDLCLNDNQRESISPNHSLKAVVYRSNCGATTGFSTRVTILPVKQKLPNDAASIFIVDGEPEVAVRWIDDQQLNIFLRDSAAVFEQLFVFNGVRVNYL